MSHAGQRAADDVRRIEPTAGQDLGDHRRRGRLAVGPGHGHTATAPHQRPQRGAAVQDAQSTAIVASASSGLVSRIAGGGDDGLRVAQLLGPVPDVDPRTPGRQRPQVLRVLPIAAADREAQLQQRRRDAVHPGSADADEVHRARGRRAPAGRRCRSAAIRPIRRLTSESRGAPGHRARRSPRPEPTPARARSIPASRAGSVDQAGHLARSTQSAVQSASASSRPPPEVDDELRRCAPARRCRAGRARRRPAIRQQPSPTRCWPRTGPASGRPPRTHPPLLNVADRPVAAPDSGSVYAGLVGEVLRTQHVQDLHPGGQQPVPGAARRTVDAGRALRSAADQQGGQCRGGARNRPRQRLSRAARSSSVMRAAQRQSDAAWRAPAACRERRCRPPAAIARPACWPDRATHSARA